MAAAEDRITGPIDNSRRAVLRNHVHPKAQAADDRGAVDPASPDYRRWLAPEEFAGRLGLTGNDVGKLTAWLTAQGFQVNDVAHGRQWIAFSGTAGQALRAFRTAIHRYRTAVQDHFANVSDPSVPAAFAGVVNGIRGLHDFSMRPMPAPETTAESGSPQTNGGTTQYIAPDDFATIFTVAPLYAAGTDGSGTSIAVAGNDPGIHLFGPDPDLTGAFSEANVAFSGIPSGLVGVSQVNFTVPQGVAAGTQPIVVTVGSVDSAPFNLQVTQ